jgi:transcriptional regulator with XRE-family HTH domain
MSPRITAPQPGLAQAVRSLRTRLGFTQAYLSTCTGIHATWISHIESGRINPTWDNVRRIAAGLEVPLGVLADLAEENEGDSLTAELRAGTYELPEQASPPVPPAPPPLPPIPEPLVEDLDEIFMRFEAFREDLKSEAEARQVVRASKARRPTER